MKCSFLKLLFIFLILLLSCDQNNKIKIIENCAQDEFLSAYGGDVSNKIYWEVELKKVDVINEFSNLYKFIQNKKKDFAYDRPSRTIELFPDLRVQLNKHEYDEFDKKVSNEINKMYAIYNKKMSNFIKLKTEEKFQFAGYENYFNRCEAWYQKYPAKMEIKYKKLEFNPFTIFPELK